MRFYRRAVSVILVLIILAAAFAVAGCATLIDEHRAAPAGWPILTTTDHVVGGMEVIQRCSKYTPWYWWPPMACVEIDFDARTCDIWRAFDASTDMIEHELMHCRGLSHPGETWAENALRAWRATVAGEAVGGARDH